MIRKVLFAAYAAVLLAMAGATIAEKYRGSDFVHSYIYGSPWFALLWGVVAAAGVAWMARRRVRQWHTLALHLSLLLILAGALTTHLTAKRGMIHLRQGEATDVYVENLGKDGVAERRLPFSLRLDKFTIDYHEGTRAEADYISELTIIDNDGETRGTVSMNNILSHRSVRLYQSSYDRDLRGSIIAMNADPWGIPLTYAGYALLFVSLVWMLLAPNGAYRRLLRNPLLRRGLVSIAALAALGQTATAAPTLPRETAESFGRLYILYNDRICPVQTFAIDFTKKLYGKATYDGLTAEQVLTGWIFFGEEWSREPMLRLKDGEMKAALQLPDYVSVATFFNRDMGGYIIGPYVREYFQGNRDAFHRQVADVDDRIEMAMELRRGTLLKIFPYTDNGNTVWYAPTDKIGAGVESDHRLYIENVFSILYQSVLDGDNAGTMELIDKMGRYQQKNAGATLPTETQTKAERIYNAVPFATALFMVCLTMGFLTLFIEIWRLTRGARPKALRAIRAVSVAIMALSFAALTLCEALRWTVSGTIPMANGYETMLFVAWAIMLVALVAARRFAIALTFGFLMAGFFLLVSHIGQMNPAIGRIMPVLNSPLLSVHVSVIMLAFALLSLTFVCGLTAIILAALKRFNTNDASLAEQLTALQLLSRLFLYPAIATLAMGIFIGAIWANVSWGQYWAWDPKEVWALITLMVYAIALHTDTLPALRRPLAYHAFCAAAFLTILMTYFGVNYFLGGMHSYA